MNFGWLRMIRPAVPCLLALGLSVAGCEADRPRPAGSVEPATGTQPASTAAEAPRQPVAAPAGTEARPPVRLDEIRPGATPPPGDATRGSGGLNIEAPSPWRNAPGGSRRF